MDESLDSYLENMACEPETEDVELVTWIGSMHGSCIMAVMYLSSTTGEHSGERSQSKQSRAEKDFENCEDCRKANQFAIPPMHFTCPKHVMVLVCPICLDHEADYHSPKNCPAVRSGKLTARKPKVYFVPKEVKRD